LIREILLALLIDLGVNAHLACSIKKDPQILMYTSIDGCQERGERRMKPTDAVP